MARSRIICGGAGHTRFMESDKEKTPAGGVASANEYTGSLQGVPVTDEEVKKLRRRYGVER